jgi:hypothetical protein
MVLHIKDHFHPGSRGRETVINAPFLEAGAIEQNPYVVCVESDPLLARLSL